MSNTYICTDLHGQYNLWKQIIEYLQPDDKLYCLGDCIDRGESGLKILLEALTDSRITLLKGNHEDMMAKSMSLYLNNKDDELGLYMNNWLFDNGGLDTFDSIKTFFKDSEEIETLLSVVDNLPDRAIYHSPNGHTIIMTHSGWDGDMNAYIACNGRKFNPRLWDRDHIWDSEHFSYADKDIPEDTYIVHGHTPVLIKEFFYSYWEEHDADNPAEWKPIHYAGGKKIDLDLGSFATHKVALFNADTFEEKIFSDNTRA